MGVESELESTTDRPTDDVAEDIKAIAPSGFLYCKSDGSIRAGFETVSHPATLKVHQRAWPAICKKMREVGMSAESNCGIHIHMNKSFFATEAQRVVLGLLFSCNEAEISAIARRSKSRWAKFKKIKPLDLEDVVKSRERYEAINWTQEHTVEFRIFAASTSENVVLANLEFVHAVCSFVKGVATVGMVTSDGHGWYELCQYISNKPKLYPHLRKHMEMVGAWTEAPLKKNILPNIKQVLSDIETMRKIVLKSNLKMIKFVKGLPTIPCV